MNYIMNCPFRLLEQAFENLYPGKKYTAVFDTMMPLGLFKKVYGETLFPDSKEDGDPIIKLNAKVNIIILPEIYAHEMAHVVAGIDHGHDLVWEDHFEAIFQEFGRLVKEKGWSETENA